MAVALVAITVIASLADALAPSPSGPESSSFSTSPEGLAAWAELLREDGRRVVAIRADPDDEALALPRGSTVVVLDPRRITEPETRALRGVARRGGVVIAGGVATDRWAGDLLGEEVEWGPGGGKLVRPFIPTRETADVRTLRTAEDGVWRDAKGALPILGTRRDGALVIGSDVGEGRVLLLADASPLQNRLLDEADNARFALDVVGPRANTVYFIEAVHGYGEQGGLAAIPARFKWGLGLFAFAALLLMVARGRRLGPPEIARRALPPPRRAYVDAIGASLARTRDPGTALEPLRAAARERVRRRAGLPQDAPHERVAKAGYELGLTEREAAAAAGLEGTEGDVLAAGAALAVITQQGGRT